MPELDAIHERLVSPRLVFAQIRRLRHCQGQNVIYGQVVNVIIDVNNFVNKLPRNIDDDYTINVHIKRKLIHKKSYLQGMVKKSILIPWLQYLVQTPLYKMYNITIDHSFLNSPNFPMPAENITNNDHNLDSNKNICLLCYVN